MGQTVLILGGGVGGVVAANVLRKRLSTAHRVIVVDREPSFQLAASFLWVMDGQRQPQQVSRELARLERKGIEVIRGEVERLDPAKREAVVAGQTLKGDHLIVALGADFAPEAVEGLAESGDTFCNLDGATRLRAALATFEKGRIVVLTAAPAYKCPAAPYEAAMLIENRLRLRGRRTESRIDLYTAEPAPMGVAGPEASAAVSAMVLEKGIGYHPEHQVTRVDAKARRLEFSNGATADFDLLVYVPPVQAPRVVRESRLADDTGWVPVDRHTMATPFENVCALGDVTRIPLEMGKPLPKAGVFAHGQAVVVARNIAATLERRPASARYDGRGACFVEAGAGRAGYGSGDFYASPRPRVAMRGPSRLWHAGKVLFEKDWFWRWL